MKDQTKKACTIILTYLIQGTKLLGSAITSLYKQIYDYFLEEAKTKALQNNVRIAEGNAVACMNEISDFLAFEAKLLHEFGVAKDSIFYMRLLGCDNGCVVFAIPKYNIHNQTEPELLSRLIYLLNQRLPLFQKSGSQSYGITNFQCTYKVISSGLRFVSIQDDWIELIFKVHIHGA